MTEFSQSVGNPRQIYIFNSRKSGKKGKIKWTQSKQQESLGKAIQADERYVRYNEAMKANDADMELQELIGEFNLARQNVALEMSKSKEEQNKEKLDTQNKEMQRLYTLVMQNEHMADFTMAKADMDKLLHEINGIIALCCDGEDPDTCEVQAGGCSGSCSTCGGCH